MDANLHIQYVHQNAKPVMLIIVVIEQLNHVLMVVVHIIQIVPASARLVIQTTVAIVPPNLAITVANHIMPIALQTVKPAKPVPQQIVRLIL